MALDRAITIAERAGHGGETDDWHAAKDAIRVEMLDRGRSERLGAVPQSYEGETLDASALLIPIIGLLPADDPPSLATADQIAARPASTASPTATFPPRRRDTRATRCRSASSRAPFYPAPSG